MVIQPLREDLLNDIGEDFARRLRRGEQPSPGEYSRKYPPHQADEIEEFLESIAMLEDLKRGEPKAESSARSLPESFGRYRIIRTLGEGGMGAVYLAEDTQLNRRVALKTPKFSRHSDQTVIDRFYREARSAATLHHPNICPVYDVGEIDGIHYLSMALIEGRPLSEFIQSKTLPPIASAVRVVRKVAAALHEAHSHGVVHRDLKPANIMIDRFHEPIVMDFGLARQFGQDEESDGEPRVAWNPQAPAISDTARARLTQDGTLVGSPGYMSPEQIRGEHGEIGPASDVYALGVLLYELLTGQLPFPGDGTFLSIVTAVVTQDPPDASSVRRDIDPQLAAICRKALAKEVAARYASMKDFSAALTLYLKSPAKEPAKESASGTSALPQVGAAASAEMVRAQEQCELVRELYQDGQYTAASSILEKMAASQDAQATPFAQWARQELPKVKARAQRQNPAAPLAALTSSDTFWDQLFDAPAAAPGHFATAPTWAAASAAQGDDDVSRWLYAAVLIPIVVFVALVIRSQFRSDPDAVALHKKIANDPAAETITEPPTQNPPTSTQPTPSNPATPNSLPTTSPTTSQSDTANPQPSNPETPVTQPLDPKPNEPPPVTEPKPVPQPSDPTLPAGQPVTAGPSETNQPEPDKPKSATPDNKPADDKPPADNKTGNDSTNRVMRLDKNGDHKISWEELKTFDAVAWDLVREFGKLDSDNNRFLDEQELKKYKPRSYTPGGRNQNWRFGPNKQSFGKRS